VPPYEYVADRFPRYTRVDGENQFLVPIPRCNRCYLPITRDFARTTGLCASCFSGGPVDGTRLRQIVAATVYIPEVTGYPHTQEILDLKSSGAHADAYADVLFHVLNDAMPDLRPAFATPVPSQEAGKPREGVHQIAASLAQMYAVRELEVLHYTRRVLRQRGLKKIDRRANLEGALVATARVPRGVALIVDDVATTGYTIAEATRALMAAGASSGVGAVVGRDMRLEDLAKVGALKTVEG
jgi:predicted amidophosphoribosyltransferase